MAPLVLWQNDGQAALASFAQGNQFFVPGTPAVPGSTFTTVDAAANWFEIPLLGADYLLLDYQSNIVAAGGITLVTKSELIVCAYGIAARSNLSSGVTQVSLNKPMAARGTQGNIGKGGAIGNTTRGAGQSLAVVCGDRTAVIAGGNTPSYDPKSIADTAVCSAAMFTAGSTTGVTPAVTDFPGWILNIGSAMVSALTSPLQVTGLHTVFVNLNVNNAFTGSPSVTLQIAGVLTAIRVKR